MNIMTSLSTFIHTWAAISWSTSQLGPSWPCPPVRLSPSLAHTYLVSSLFVLAHPVACCLSQRFIFQLYNPPFTTRRLNTFILVNIMGARYNICNRYNMYYNHICSSQLLLLCLYLTSGQACWPRTFMSGTVWIYSRISSPLTTLAWICCMLSAHVQQDQTQFVVMSCTVIIESV